MRRRTALLATVAIALAVGGLAGGVFAKAPTAGPQPPPQALADRALAGAASGDTAATVARLEQQVLANPRDASLLVQLGFAYQLRWRETADSSYLPLAGRALTRALRIKSDDPSAVLGLGSLALIRHQFRAALDDGRRAARLLPGSATPYGVIGDALVELGRYPAAFAAFERMVSLRPSLASYARIAYARELEGDNRGALAAMRLALDAAGGEPEPTAWSLVEVAKLEVLLGRKRDAERHVDDALRVLPGYPAAEVELAVVESALERLDRAVADARRAANTVPTMQALGLYAALLDRTGRPVAAIRQRATIGIVERLLRANGVRVDLEAAVYQADYGIEPLRTIALARRAQADRPSIYGDDALGWALARAGRCAQALVWERRALRLGTRDPLLFFHRGYAEGCAGDRSAMARWYRQALSLNPEFSPRWAPVAAAAVSRYG